MCCIDCWGRDFSGLGVWGGGGVCLINRWDWNTCINISMVLFTFFITDFAAQRMLPDYLPQRLLWGIMAMQLPGAESRHHPARPPGFCREVSAGGDRATARGDSQLLGLKSFRDRWRLQVFWLQADQPCPSSWERFVLCRGWDDFFPHTHELSPNRHYKTGGRQGWKPRKVLR